MCVCVCECREDSKWHCSANDTVRMFVCTQAQLVGHAAKTFWIPLIHLDETSTGKYPASSRERVKIADVPSSMELLNDPGMKLRAGLYYRA